jgi:Spy/CpxP family protein refolding chaperone
MKNQRTTLFLITLTVLTLGAGVVTGMLAHRLPSGGSDLNVEPAGSATLLEELQLTPTQRDQMRTIWENVRADVQDCYHDAQNLQRQRDQEIVALLDDRQKAEFEKISKDYADRYTKLTQKRDETFQRAVDRTRQLLDEKQRAKYEEILKSRLGKLAPARVEG